MYVMSVVMIIAVVAVTGGNFAEKRKEKNFRKKIKICILRGAEGLRGKSNVRNFEVKIMAYGGEEGA